jgi:uncharacterized protein (TIGR00255 family)
MRLGKAEENCIFPLALHSVFTIFANQTTKREESTEMVKSMTGYGKATATVSTKTITVEIRSLNSKQLDLSIKLLPVYRQQEYELRAEAAKIIGRGKVDIFVTVEDSSPAPGVTINKHLFAGYYRQIKDALKVAGMNIINNDVKTSGMVGTIMRLPDVLVSQVAEVSEDESRALFVALDDALTHLNAFREQEGRVLMADMLARVDRISNLTEQVTPFEVARVEAVRQRILAHIEKLGIETDHNRLEQELVFYIEKLDITEEKVRLTNHCKYFAQTAAEEGGVGHKLGFIAQEMGREINTLGSKANNSDIQRLVVQMKDELEKIKEQILNIL